MSQWTGTANQSNCGSIEIEAEASEVCEALCRLFPGPKPTIHRYRWKPPSFLVHQLPPNFGFALRCVVSERGRRFWPVNGPEDYVAAAFAGGLALLSATHNLSAEQQSEYCEFYQVYRRLRATREHLLTAAQPA